MSTRQHDRIIRVDDDLYHALARQRKGGESFNDVLRRRLDLPKYGKWESRRTTRVSRDANGRPLNILTAFPCGHGLARFRMCGQQSPSGLQPAKPREVYIRGCRTCKASWTVTRSGERLTWALEQYGNKDVNGEGQR